MKKKAGSSSSKPSAKGVAALQKTKSGGSSSGSFTMWDRAEGLFQEVLAPSVVADIFGAVKRYNAVLANHVRGVTYQSLQVKPILSSILLSLLPLVNLF